MYVKRFNSKREVVVAACDSELLGRCFQEGKLTLEVKKEFYGGSLVNIEDALEMIESSTIANMVGDRIISMAIKAGIICEEGVIRVSGVPHAQRIVV